MADFTPQLRSLARHLRSSGVLEPCQALTSDNPSWDRAATHYLIVRLSPLHDVASSTGHLFLHRLLRTVLGKDAFIDFSFFPSRLERKELSTAGVPYMYGMFGRRGPEDYSAVLVSCSYAPELVNVPSMLRNSGMPVRSGDRQAPRPDGGVWPLVLLGGSNALASQSLIFPDGDSFVDGIFFGEGESAGPSLVRAMAESEGMASGERARRISAACDSFWAAGAIDAGPVTVSRFHPDGADPLMVDAYPVLNTDEASTARVRLSWGCPSTCSFCFEGWEHKPYREVPKDVILSAARRLAVNTGASTLELYSFNFNAHSDIGGLILGLNRIFDHVNMMSQRADLLVSTPRMLDLELAAGKSSFTIGVEGISDGMRAYYSKGLSAGVINRLLERLARERVREIKLFYILAGIETDADMAEFETFCRHLEDVRQKADRGLRIVFSFGYLVRMPFTPLRGAALCLDRRHLEGMAGRLRTIVEKSRFEFRLATDWDEYVVDQMLVLGPHAMADALMSATAGGAAFDGSIEGNVRGDLEMALRASGDLDADGLRGRLVEAKTPGYRYPLEFLVTATDSDHLAASGADAFARRNRGSCMAGFQTPGAGSCLGCGACETDLERAALTNHGISPIDASLVTEIDGLVRAKRRMKPRYVRSRLPVSLSGATREFLNAWLMRAVLAAAPELLGTVLRIEEALWSSPDWRDRLVEGMTGDCVLAVYGLGGGVPGQAPEISDDAFDMACRALGQALGCGCAPIDSSQLPEVSEVAVRITLAENPGEQEVLKMTRAYLADLKLNAIERRADGGRLFEMAPKDLKKRILRSVRVLMPADQQSPPVLLLEGASRLDISPLFRRAGDRAATVLDVERLTLT